MLHYKNLDLQDIVYFCEVDLIEKTEQWKDIPNYEGLYMVSDLGRVKSLFYRAKPKHGILKQSDSAKGYLLASLHKDKIGIKRMVHILVAMAFLNHNTSNRNLVVDHIFQNRKDSRLLFLQIITQRENTNQKHLESSSEFTGVYWHKTHEKWMSAIRIEDKKFHLGTFVNEKEASEAYETALKNWLEHKIKPEKKKFSSQYKGVTFFKARNKWCAKIKLNGKLTHVGIFKTEFEAHLAFEEAIRLNPNATA